MAGDYKLWKAKSCCTGSGNIDVYAQIPTPSTKIFAFYDATSLSADTAAQASTSIRAWYQTKVNNKQLLPGNLYEGVIGITGSSGENWMWWMCYPYLGSLNGGTLGDGTAVAELNKNAVFNDGNTKYQRINRGQDVSTGADDSRSNGVPFPHANLNKKSNTGQGAFAGKITNYMVIAVVDEADSNAQSANYHGEALNLNGQPRTGYINEYRQFLKVWKFLKTIKGARFNGFVYPDASGGGATRKAHVYMATAAVEGDTISAADFQAKYGQPITKVGPQNLNLSVLSVQAPYRTLTAQPEYTALPAHLQKGAGLKNFGIRLDPTVNGYTEAVVTTSLDTFLGEVEMSPGKGFSHQGVCYQVQELFTQPENTIPGGALSVAEIDIIYDFNPCSLPECACKDTPIGPTPPPATPIPTLPPTPTPEPPPPEPTPTLTDYIKPDDCIENFAYEMNKHFVNIKDSLYRLTECCNKDVCLPPFVDEPDKQNKVRCVEPEPPSLCPPFTYICDAKWTPVNGPKFYDTIVLDCPKTIPTGYVMCNESNAMYITGPVIVDKEMIGAINVNTSDVFVHGDITFTNPDLTTPIPLANVIQTNTGSIYIKGNVNGNISSNTGNIYVHGNVTGNVTLNSGRIYMKPGKTISGTHDPSKVLPYPSTDPIPALPWPTYPTSSGQEWTKCQLTPEPTPVPKLDCNAELIPNCSQTMESGGTTGWANWSCIPQNNPDVVFGKIKDTIVSIKLSNSSWYSGISNNQQRFGLSPNSVRANMFYEGVNSLYPAYTTTEVAPPPATEQSFLAHNQADTLTICATQTLPALYFAYASLNANTLTFNKDFEIVVNDRGAWGSGTVEKRVNGDGTFSLVSTNAEPHGILKFAGNIQELVVTVARSETWYGFTIGSEETFITAPCNTAELKVTYTFSNNLNAKEAGKPSLVPVNPSNLNQFVEDVAYGKPDVAYEFNGSTSFVSQGGFTLDATDLVDYDNYSIELIIKLTDTSTRPKIFDVTNRTQDYGVYVTPDNKLALKTPDGIAVGLDAVDWADSYQHIVITSYVAPGINEANIYLNGKKQITKQTDVLSIKNNSDHIISFFLNDNKSAFEWSSGRIARMKLHEGLLCEETIVVPEACIPKRQDLLDRFTLQGEGGYQWDTFNFIDRDKMYVTSSFSNAYYAGVLGAAANYSEYANTVTINGTQYIGLKGLLRFCAGNDNRSAIFRDGVCYTAGTKHTARPWIPNNLAQMKDLFMPSAYDSSYCQLVLMINGELRLLDLDNEASMANPPIVTGTSVAGTVTTLNNVERFLAINQAHMKDLLVACTDDTVWHVQCGNGAATARQVSNLKASEILFATIGDPGDACWVVMKKEPRNLYKLVNAGRNLGAFSWITSKAATRTELTPFVYYGTNSTNLLEADEFFIDGCANEFHYTFMTNKYIHTFKAAQYGGYPGQNPVYVKHPYPANIKPVSMRPATSYAMACELSDGFYLLSSNGIVKFLNGTGSSATEYYPAYQYLDKIQHWTDLALTLAPSRPDIIIFNTSCSDPFDPEDGGGNEFEGELPDVDPYPDGPPQAGLNAAFVGFGGSTGALTNEHWLHDFRWRSRYNAFNFSDFLSNCTLSNRATIIDNKLRFTEAAGNQTGNSFLTLPVYMLESGTCNAIDWSCYFVISMGGGSRADGISFIVQSNTADTGGFGGGIAYSGIPNSFAVSYDTYRNAFDPNNNHVEINVNGSVESLETATPIIDLCGTAGTNKLIYNWVDYTAGILSVYCSEANVKPAAPILSRAINVKDYIIILPPCDQ